ncbi:MAG: hypothetical protein UT24_C0012G0057 [Candidatus Woesebacteria bacterium GW2011_GWB1_39_12]|uniref:5'-deoxynucleotidase n=2 Tax=Candidatus Woeseibacteriota TaxID=1752722 RepID=A0A0G0Q7V1_9BACT|nr:MAG: hypothetical protein UT23_C0008G0019 [Candidatus Woesebacteria bacterium GW2011_GWA1_39_12]KKR00435.1 MAG: hypothetical protein UT24_C0012G0057 [Candidatus Woesebacteria bacterium GW2011_GWB1_39_12]
MMKTIKDLYSIISVLKKTKRQGWIYKGMDSDDLASHIFGAMCIGLYLAKLEKVNSEKVVKILLVHDWVMAKMDDVIPPSGNYDKKRLMEEKAKRTVFNELPSVIKKEYMNLFNEFNSMKTKESQIAREADKLETLLQGEVFEEETQDTKVLDTFFENYKPVFKSKNGSKIFKELEKRDLKRAKKI